MFKHDVNSVKKKEVISSGSGAEGDLIHVEGVCALSTGTSFLAARVGQSRRGLPGEAAEPPLCPV